MTPAQRLAAFLRPTLAVALVFAGVVGFRTLGFFRGEGQQPDFILPGAVTAEQHPDGVDQLVRPTPELSPVDVVQTQLAGLSDPKADGVGVLQCYLFASPANRAVTGPLDRFGEMVRREPFACFARPHATLVGQPKIEGSLARLLVTVMDQNHRLMAFAFILSRQTKAPFENCWMTEAVYPLQDFVPPSGAEEGPSADDSAAI